MKKLLLLLFFFQILNGCNADNDKSEKQNYSSAFEYNDALVNAQGLIIQQMTKLLSLETTEQMELMIPNFSKVINESIKITKGITFEKNDFGMKEAFLNQMEFYKVEVTPILLMMIELSDQMDLIDENDDENFLLIWDEYIDLVNMVTEKEKPYDNAIKISQGKFIKAYNMYLKNNPFMEEMEEAVEGTDKIKIFWDEMILGCVNGDESTRDFCTCLIKQISKDYKATDILIMDTDEIEKLSLKYSINCE